MKFERVPVSHSIGAVLAHAERTDAGVLKKGRVVSEEDAAAMERAGVRSVFVARLETDDAPEDLAAEQLAEALAPRPEAALIRRTEPVAGRVNLMAAAAGRLRLNAEAVRAINRIDEAITVATLTDGARVEAGRLLATIKIIPYAAPRAALDAAIDLAAAARAVEVAPFRPMRVALIQTTTDALKPSILSKGAEVVGDRIRSLGSELCSETIAAHTEAALAQAIAAAPGDLVLVLTASATSDRRDVCPAAIEAAGGRVERVGMPVDPGNLLVLGAQGGRPVVGLPGCARSPALNGADWVLERIAAGDEIRSTDIAEMGVGGLLKEISSRPQPRTANPATPRARRRVSAVLLAAGGARRMGAHGHKLLKRVDGEPLVRRAARVLAKSPAHETIVVIGSEAQAMREALSGLPVRMTEAARWRAGVAESLKAGLAAVDPTADAALIALADMPNVGAALIAEIIDGFDPDAGADIVRPDAARDGGGRLPGHPVLFGRRFFEALAALEGDVGARAIVAAHRDHLRTIALEDADALLDLDTPEAWDAFQAARGAGRGEI